VSAAITYQNAQWGLVPTEGYTPHLDQKVYGVALSRSGTELLTIVDAEPDEKYTQALHDYWKKRHLSMTKIGA
jgi:hypothetical protein